MLQKARFLAVDGIRTSQTIDSVTGTSKPVWWVKYLVEYDVEGANGSFKQQLLAEASYDQEPNLQVGPLDSSKLYEMKFTFTVSTSKKDGHRFQNIRLSRYTEVVSMPKA